MRFGPFPRVSTRGFTIIELLISLAIMGMMMGILLSSYPETAIRLALVNVSHTGSLLLREAQVRGSAIDSGNASLEEESPYGGYGVFVNTTAPGIMVLFNDFVDPSGIKPLGLAVGDGFYEGVDDGCTGNDHNNGNGNSCGNDSENPGRGGGGGGGGGSVLDETNRVILLPKGYYISKLCVANEIPFVFKCNGDNSPEVKNLTISFTRPNPQPSIYINGSDSVNFSAACIELRSPRAPAVGHVRAVQIFNSGMIRTQTGHCDNSTL